MDKVQVFVKVFTLIAVPVMAFWIRMFEGDTKTDQEEVISTFARSTWSKFRGWLDRRTNATDYQPAQQG